VVQWFRRHGPIVAALAGFAASLALFLPGDMRDPDAIEQYAQSLSFHFTDWHPPAMALLWWVTNHLWRGPQGLLLLQLASYWAAAFFVLRAVEPFVTAPRFAIIVAVLCVPCLVGLLGQIEKDTQLACAWAFAACVVFGWRSGGRTAPWWLTGVVLVVVAYGAIVRHNAAVAVGPIAVYAATGRPVRASARQTVVSYALATVLALSASQALNAALAVQRTGIARALMAFDLIGVSVRTGQNELPFALSSVDFGRVKGCYDGMSQDAYIFNGCSFVWPAIDGTSDRAMTIAWARAIVHHPLAYAAHRSGVFRQLAAKRSSESLGHFAKVVFARPLPYFIWLIGLTIVAWRLGATQADLIPGARWFVQAELAVAGLYVATLLPGAPAADFRYVFPVIVALSVATPVLLAELPQARGRSVRPASDGPTAHGIVPEPHARRRRDSAGEVSGRS
jgi:hypothetical protein